MVTVGLGGCVTYDDRSSRDLWRPIARRGGFSLRCQWSGGWVDESHCLFGVLRCVAIWLGLDDGGDWVLDEQTATFIA